MEAIKNGLRKNLTPAQLWSGARFFLLLNLGLIILSLIHIWCRKVSARASTGRVLPSFISRMKGTSLSTISKGPWKNSPLWKEPELTHCISIIRQLEVE